MPLLHTKKPCKSGASETEEGNPLSEIRFCLILQGFLIFEPIARANPRLLLPQNPAFTEF